MPLDGLVDQTQGLITQGVVEVARRLAINSHGFIAENSRDAAETFYPPYAQIMTKIGRERGWSPMTREQFEALRARRGSLLVGSPQEVIEKMLYEHELFKFDRFLLHLSVGTMPHDQVMRSIELLGTKVAPIIRKEIARSPVVEAVVLVEPVREDERVKCGASLRLVQRGRGKLLDALKQRLPANGMRSNPPRLVQIFGHHNIHHGERKRGISTGKWLDMLVG